MTNNHIIEIIKSKIDKKGFFQPVLFLSNNKDHTDLIVNNLINELFTFYNVDKNNLYKLSDNGESIKISQIREFISKGNLGASFLFQIFLIENISRLTLESANACLKFLEEPGKGNIIFLTNNSESGIIETILSRVQVINLFGKDTFLHDQFFYSLIDNFLSKKDISLIKYFFQDKKLEKKDYIIFLNTFLFYIKQKGVYLDLSENISESLDLIQKNNVLPKYEIDKLLIKIGTL